MRLVLLVVLLVVSGCGTQVLCSTPYILSDNTCCLDENNDNTCDEQQRPSEVAGKRLVSSEELPDVELIESSPVVPLRRSSPSVQTYPAKGNPDADVTFAFFGDYTDRYSSRFYREVLPRLLERYGDYVSFVYHAVPRGMDIYSTYPAEAAQCASEQGKFWEYHDLLYRDVTKLGPVYLESYAQDLGLAMDQFRTCLASRKYAQRVLDGLIMARDRGVTVLPTVFIQQTRVSGFRDHAAYEEVLDLYLYDKLVDIEDRHTIAVSATGKAFDILEGPSFDGSVALTPYSDVVQSVYATLSFDAEDVLVHGRADDRANVLLTVKLLEYERLTETVYKIQLTNLKRDDRFFGGVARDVLVFGDTGIVTNLLPTTRASVALFGEANIFDRRDRLLVENATFYLFVTEGLRTNGLLQGAVEPDDWEVHIILPGQYIEESFLEDRKFLYFFFEDVTYRIV